MSTCVSFSPRRTRLMATCSSLIGSTTLMIANVVPMKPVTSPAPMSATMAAVSSPTVPVKYPPRCARVSSKTPAIGTAEVVNQVRYRRDLIGGCSVESSKRRASADAAIGRTRRSACRYVSTAVTKQVRMAEVRTTVARRASIRNAAMVTIAMPMPHTATTMAVCSTGRRITRWRTMFGSCPSGWRCHSSTGRNRYSVTTTPRITATTA